MKEEQSCLFHVQAVMRQLVGMQKESIGDLDESTAEGLKGLARRLGYLFPEQAIDSGDRAMRMRYFEEVVSVAEELIEEAKENEFDYEEADRWLWETMDGHEWVIYTAKAQMVLMFSDHDGAYIEELGGEGVVADGCINWSSLAFMAMKGDVQDALDGLDFDWDNPAGEEDEDEDED